MENSATLKGSGGVWETERRQPLTNYSTHENGKHKKDVSVSIHSLHDRYRIPEQLITELIT